MEEKAKGRFLTKLAYQGFLMEEREGTLILKPSGAAEEATIIIAEYYPNMWTVTGASGLYARYHRGKDRVYFEQTINGLATQAVLEAQETP